MTTGKTLLALALSTLLPASAAFAASNDTLIYCSEASPESFNPQIASSARRLSPARRCSIPALSPSIR